MHVRRFAVVALALLMSFAPVAGVPQDASGPVAVTHARLKNGMQIYVLRNRLSPVVSMWTNYFVGSNDETTTGLAHAQEHMMFRGSNSITSSQFAETTAITGGSFNADTQNEITQYFFEMPSQYLDIALNLERSRATGLLDTQKDWDQERGAITQEVTRDNGSAFYRLYTKTLEHMFTGTPYANAGLGTVDSFKRLQAPELQAFYKKWYHPNNALMVIAGDVDPDATIAKVRALFEAIPLTPVPAHPAVHLQPLTPITFRDNSSDPITLALVAYRVPGYNDPDYFASEILNDVLNSPRGALYDLQATGKSLQSFAESITHPEGAISLVGSAVPTTTSGDDAVTNLKAVIEKYKESGLPPELVDVAKQREVAQAQFTQNSISGLASTWSSALAIEHRTPDDDLAGLQKVTIDDVNRVLRTWYDNSTATVSIATPKDAAGSAFGGRAGEDNTIVPVPNTKLPVFAKNVLSQLHVPESTVHPNVQTLANGLKIITVQSSITPTVVLRGEVRNNAGVQAPAGKEGVDSIVNGLFEFGTTTYGRVPLQVELDKIAANMNAGTSFGLDVLKSSFDRGVQLLADDELHPAFPADAFAIVKSQTVGELTGAVRGPDYKASVALTQALYPAGDPARRRATPQSAGNITLDDVKAYYNASFRPDLTTIVVVGDVTPDDVRTTIAASFGAWTATGPQPAIYPPAVPKNKPSRTSIPATGRVQSDVTLAQTIPITNTNPDMPVLQLANAVLTGATFASLLYHDLRVVHGYVYSVDSSFAAGHNRSTFTVSYSADTKNIENAQKLVADDLTSLQKKPMTVERLTRAKALVLGELPIRQDSFEGVAGQLLNYAVTGRPLDSDRIAARAQLAATPERVRAALAKWIRPNGFAQVILAPSK